MILPAFVGRSTIPRVPAAITIKEISNILPVPTLSVMKPPPTLPNRENHLFIAASVAANVTVAPRILVAYGVK